MHLGFSALFSLTLFLTRHLTVRCFTDDPAVIAEGVTDVYKRQASLYLVKNVFTFVLSLITLFFTLPYPYTPAQLSLVNALTIGIQMCIRDSGRHDHHR